nr:MAG TPA: hypothetical protein [Caudoviricetes sp.]
MSRYTRATVEYGLLDQTAPQDNVFSIDEIQPFSDTAELNNGGRKIKKWATLENTGFLMDGTFELPPDDLSAEFMGVWSKKLSGKDGMFSSPPVLSIAFSEAHTSAGLTLNFSEATADWCNNLNIIWYDQAGAQIANRDFSPNAAVYFCDCQVEDFYGLKITFYRTNQPYHFLKLTGIRYGILMQLDASRLITCSVLEEVDPISSELSINTMTFSFHSEKGEFDLLDLTGAYVLFQQRQEIKVLGEMDGIKMDMGTFYLNEPKSDTDGTVTMQCIDLIGTMDNTEYLGGYWPDGIAAGNLIDEIVASAGVKAAMFEIESTLRTRKIYGYLPICTHREALRQVAFALCAVVDCSRSGIITIRKGTHVSTLIPLDRKVVGHTQEQSALVTGVEVYVSNYTLGDSSTKLFEKECPIGTFLAKFSSPAANVTCSGGTITENGINYAKIDVKTAGMVTITGTTYEESKSLSGSVYAENLPANAMPNVLQIEDCTLHVDAQVLAQHIFDHYQRRIIDTGRILLSDETVGDWVELQNSSGKVLEGTVEQMDIDLTGGFIAKAVIRGNGKSDL